MRASASLLAWAKQRCGWPERRGERHWRPSTKVNEHKDTRSFALRVDIKVSLELSFGILPDGKRKSRQDAGGTKQKRPSWAGAQFATGVLYHDGNAGQVEESWATAR